VVYDCSRKGIKYGRYDRKRKTVSRVQPAYCFTGRCGAGAGLITVLIRKWGAFPEGVTYGILIMNVVSPFLNRLLARKYGFVKKVAKPADISK
jgi:hypothetical protein